MFFTPCSAATSASITATAWEMQGGTRVPVRGPKGSRLMEMPFSSYRPTSRSTYIQSVMVRSRETLLA